MDDNLQKKIAVSKKTTALKAICVIAFSVAIGVGAFFYLSQSSKEVLGENQFEYENNAMIGLMPGVDRDAMLDAMQNNVDESAIAFSINGNPVAQNSQINIMFENPDGNNKDLVIEIFENETESSLFKSKAIREGSYLNEVTLDKQLKKGEIPATVYITAYDKETHAIIGQAAAEIVITVT